MRNESLNRIQRGARFGFCGILTVVDESVAQLHMIGEIGPKWGLFDLIAG